MMTLHAIVHEAEEGGYWAELPGLPGCASQGETIAELRANLCEAAEACLSAAHREREAAGVAIDVEFVV
jgi:predicted RNase H-like HicB family nuclease